MSMVNILKLTSIIILVLGLFYYAGYLESVKYKINLAINKADYRTWDKNYESVTRYTGYGYRRDSALKYYLSKPISFLGKGTFIGASKRVEEQDRIFIVGQVFILYGDYGIIGLLWGYLIFFYMAYKNKDSSNDTWLPLFFSISLLTFTTDVLAGSAIMLSYCLYLKTGLIPPKIDSNE